MSEQQSVSTPEQSAEAKGEGIGSIIEKALRERNSKLLAGLLRNRHCSVAEIEATLVLIQKAQSPKAPRWIRERNLLTYAAVLEDGALSRVLLTIPAQRARINQPDAGGETPLICAVRYGRVAQIKQLLAQADIDLLGKNSNGLTAFTVAIKQRRAEIFDLLFEAAKKQSKVGHFAEPWEGQAWFAELVSQAIKSGHGDILAGLLESGHCSVAYVESFTPWNNILTYAAGLSSSRLLRALLAIPALKAKINEVDRANNETLLLCAVKADRAEAVKLLLEHGADLWWKGRNVSIFSACDHPEVMDAILSWIETQQDKSALFAKPWEDKQWFQEFVLYAFLNKKGAILTGLLLPPANCSIAYLEEYVSLCATYAPFKPYRTIFDYMVTSVHWSSKMDILMEAILRREGQEARIHREYMALIYARKYNPELALILSQGNQRFISKTEQEITEIEIELELELTLESDPEKAVHELRKRLIVTHLTLAAAYAAQACCTDELVAKRAWYEKAKQSSVQASQLKLMFGIVFARSEEMILEMIAYRYYVHVGIRDVLKKSDPTAVEEFLSTLDIDFFDMDFSDPQKFAAVMMRELYDCTIGIGNCVCPGKDASKYMRDPRWRFDRDVERNEMQKVKTRHGRHTSHYAILLSAAANLTARYAFSDALQQSAVMNSAAGLSGIRHEVIEFLGMKAKSIKAVDLLVGDVRKQIDSIKSIIIKYCRSAVCTDASLEKALTDALVKYKILKNGRDLPVKIFNDLKRYIINAVKLLEKSMPKDMDNGQLIARLTSCISLVINSYTSHLALVEDMVTKAMVEPLPTIGLVLADADPPKVNPKNMLVFAVAKDGRWQCYWNGEKLPFQLDQLIPAEDLRHIQDVMRNPVEEFPLFLKKYISAQHYKQVLVAINAATLKSTVTLGPFDLQLQAAMVSSLMWHFRYSTKKELLAQEGDIVNNLRLQLAQGYWEATYKANRPGQQQGMQFICHEREASGMMVAKQLWPKQQEAFESFFFSFLPKKEDVQQQFKRYLATSPLDEKSSPAASKHSKLLAQQLPLGEVALQTARHSAEAKLLLGMVAGADKAMSTTGKLLGVLGNDFEQGLLAEERVDAELGKSMDSQAGRSDEVLQKREAQGDAKRERKSDLDQAEREQPESPSAEQSEPSPQPKRPRREEHLPSASDDGFIAAAAARR